jgi:hypothetical protein
MQTAFVVTMIAKRSNYHYVLGVFSNETLAILAGSREERVYEGEFQYTIDKLEVDRYAK